jgi:hypothetical protein
MIPVRSWRRLCSLLLAALGGCATTPTPDVPYKPAAPGAGAQITVKTERMWAPNRVTLYLVKPGADPKSGAREVVGQLQSGEGVRREILSFDARLAAGVPLPLFFEYRYDAGSLRETGCNFDVTVTLEAGGRYLVDFIKDTRGCYPRFYVFGKDGKPVEISVVK